MSGCKERSGKMHDLVFIGAVNDEPYTTDKIISDYSGNSLHAVKNLIYEHKTDFEYFGILSFEMTKLDGRGRPRKTYHLNEMQATLLMTYLDNTDKVREFKKQLVRAFFQMRSEKLEQVRNRVAGIPQRHTLTDAIQQWEHGNRWSYKTITDLLLKQVTGMNAKQLKASRHVKNAMDGLTTSEQAKYQQLENIVTGFIGLNKTYDQIKGVLLLTSEVV